MYPLILTLSEAFNEIAERDIDWGISWVEYADEIDSGYTQWWMLQGLEKLLPIATADGYEERHRALCANGIPRHTR